MQPNEPEITNHKSVTDKSIVLNMKVFFKRNYFIGKFNTFNLINYCLFKKKIKNV